MYSRLGLSAVSERVVDAVADYAEQHRIPLMLIASRNQVDDDLPDGGYCGLSRMELVARVRRRSPTYTFVCRDHGGPYFAADDDGLSPTAASERARGSLRQDVDAGFDLVHVDWSRSGGDVVGETRELIAELVDRAAPQEIAFEVSVAETDGSVDHPIDFARTFERFADLAPVIEFAAARTGSLVRSAYQAGSFDYSAAKEIVAFAHRLGMRFKEHNVDYSPCKDLRMRTLAGVDAINIGPELGVLETRILARLASLHGATPELEALFAVAAASGRWRKWTVRTPASRMQALLAAHYCHATSEYRALIEKLDRRVDVDATIRSKLSARIDAYVRCLAVPAQSSGERYAG